MLYMLTMYMLTKYQLSNLSTIFLFTFLHDTILLFKFANSTYKIIQRKDISVREISDDRDRQRFWQETRAIFMALLIYTATASSVVL